MTAYEMSDLEIIKAFAELECIELDERVVGFAAILTHHFKGEPQFSEYNPLTDRSLTYKAMLDYKVSIRFGFQFVSRTGSKFESIVSTENKELSYAIIECILKSEGRWK